MSYLVLARKYRPKSFTEMVGQEHVVQALSNALTTQRLHHAYLFTGTRGVGKTTVSRILAKSLNCLGADGQGGITASPCGVCEACTAIDSGRFIDYTELDAASNRGVDEVQQLLEQAVYKPVQGRFKVFMIDEVHMLTNTAFNAMLKTLEEPPEYLKFVLATTDPQKVPVTVLSRCLQFNLRPMAPETIHEHLVQLMGTEQVTTDDASLRLLSRAARGSMRDALSLTDQAIAFGNGVLAEANVRQMLGAVDRSYVFRLIDALAQGDGKAVIDTSETLRLNGLSAAGTLEDMASVLQRMAVVQNVPDGYDSTDSEAVETARLAGIMPPDETQLLYSLCIHGRAELGLAPDEYAGLTMTLLRLLAFKPKGFKPANLPHAAASGPASPAPAALTDSAEKKSLNSALNSSDASPQVAPQTTPLSAPPKAPEALAANPAAAIPTSPANAQTHSPIIAGGTTASGATPSSGIASAAAASDRATTTQPAAVAAHSPVVAASHAADNSDAEPADLWPEAMDVGTQATATFHASAGTSLKAPFEPNFESNSPLVHINTAQAASNLIAIPLREQSEPTARTEQRIAPVEPDAQQDAWLDTVQQLLDAQAVTALTRELAIQSQCVEQGAQHLTLRIEMPSLKSDAARDKLQSAFAALGRSEVLVLELGPVADSWFKRNQTKLQARQKAAEDLITNDPLVLEMQAQWGAKIVAGSIKAL
jgi:DNA polymerase III subunit gamma/tau